MQFSQHGASLFSLAIALGLVAVLAATAAPGFERITRQWAAARSASGLIAALHQARSAAAARAVPVVLCQTDVPGHCTTSGTPSGWQLFADNSPTSPPRLDASDELLQAHTFPPSIELRVTRSAVTYWSTARAASTASFIVCDRRNLASPRVVIISQTGRPRLSQRLSDGSVPDCAHG